MELRMAQEKDYMQIAEMKWLHCEEDDADYNTSNLVGADKDKFLADMRGLYARAGWDPREVHFSLLDLESNLIGEDFEITFCKDCKHWKNPASCFGGRVVFGNCEVFGKPISAGHFCSIGEPKGEADE